MEKFSKLLDYPNNDCDSVEGFFVFMDYIVLFAGLVILSFIYFYKFIEIAFLKFIFIIEFIGGQLFFFYPYEIFNLIKMAN